jgi:hypothetical protein
MALMRTFTVFVPFELVSEDDAVVARKLSGEDAIRTALEMDGSWTSHLREDEYETFRLYRWEPLAKKWPNDKRTRDTLSATVVKTVDHVRDRAYGMSMIVDQFMRRWSHYSKARVETDEAFDKRLLHVAKRREVHRLDKLIATDLIDASLAHGYVVTDVSGEEFERSADRTMILDLVLDVERIELVVERDGEQSWMRLIFGENGWDLVQDYTVDLGYLIDPIVEPLLPWKKRHRVDRCDEVDTAVQKPTGDLPGTENSPK